MDSKEWERIQVLFHEVADRPEGEWRAQIEAACGGDEALRDEVLSLLEEDARGAGILDKDLTQLAQQVLVGSGDAAPSRDFGPYRLKKLLGEGGMGVVYLAERKDLGSLVAIKILKDAWLSPARRERFAIEQKTLAQFSHPSIARLYDANSLADGTPWFVMEYVEGVPLTDYCKAKNCSIEERVRLLRSVCEAVQCAHEQAIIHRDLKPSNILVKNDGTIRLLDFGIAKQVETLDQAVDRTKTGLRLMTPAYAAPEQIRGERTGTHTDVYSLGVILYELLTGQLPYELSNKTPVQADLTITKEEIQKPSVVGSRTAGGQKQAGKRVWADLDVLCLTAMHTDSERRYRSAEALMRDIDHYLKGQPLEARRDGWVYRSGKFVRRNRPTLTAAAVALAAVVAMVVFFTVRLARAKDAAVAQAERIQRIQQFMLNLFDSGDKEAGPAEHLRAIDVLEQGVRQARALSQEPEVQAELYGTLGNAFRNLGKFDRADWLLQSALEADKRTAGPGSTAVAGAEIELGLVREKEGKPQEAERLIRDGLAIDERSLAPGDPHLAKADAALGEVLEIKGEPSQALRFVDEAVQIQSKAGPSTAAHAYYLNSKGVLEFDLGKYEEATASFKRALALGRKLLGSIHPLVGEITMNLASTQFQLSHFSEAEKDYRSALDTIRSWYGANHYQTGDAMSLLGQAILQEGRLEEAESLLKQALAIQEQAYGKNNQHVAQTLNALATVVQRTGKLGEAEAYFNQSLEVERAVYGDKHYLIAVGLNNLATLYRKEGQFARAEKLGRESVRRFREELPPDHFYVCTAEISLGETLVDEKRYAEAEELLRDGYQRLSKQTSPPPNTLQQARRDLAAVYEAQGQREKANRFRAEMAKAAAPARESKQ